MEGEDSLDALVGDDSADGERFVDSAAPAGDDGAGEYLGADFVAFLYSAAHFDGVADFEVGCVFLKAFAFNSIQ